MASIDRNFEFATNGTVSAAFLHNLIDSATIFQGLITDREPTTTVGTEYQMLIADATNPNAAPNAVTVYDLFEDALTAGTYSNANISEALTYGTATGTRLVSANATITTGTITTGVIPTLTSSTATFGTTTSTAATITSGTVTNLASTTGTIATLNSTTGTIATLNSTTGTIATLNSTTGTIATLNSTTGTIATLNSTTGTITNLSTTLAGDFTISSGTGTLADGSITPAKLSQPLTQGTAVASTSGTAIDFTGIPSWAKRITFSLYNVSANGTSPFEFRLGTSSGIEASGYSGINFFSQATSVGNIVLSTGFTIDGTTAAADVRSGAVIFTLIGSNVWSGIGNFGSTIRFGSFGGAKPLTTGVLDRVRLTTQNGTDTFDAGSVNIMYEG
jgi:hypothetical protein